MNEEQENWVIDYLRNVLDTGTCKPFVLLGYINSLLTQQKEEVIGMAERLRLKPTSKLMFIPSGQRGVMDAVNGPPILDAEEQRYNQAIDDIVAKLRRELEANKIKSNDSNRF